MMRDSEAHFFLTALLLAAVPKAHGDHSCAGNGNDFQTFDVYARSMMRAFPVTF
jgi:hypothetical protein